MINILKRIALQSGKIFLTVFIICGIEYIFLLNSPGMSEQVENISQDGNLAFFYFNWFFNAVFKLNFGRTLTDGRLISESLHYSSIITFKLTIGALLITVLVVLVMAIINILHPKSAIVKAVNQFIAFFSGFHVVVLGAIAIRIFGLYGSNDVGITPLLILTFGNGALYDAVQYMVQAFIKIHNSDYIRATKARGGNIWINAQKEILITLLTLINSRFPYLIGGAFIVEYFFSINGLGMQIIHGVKGKESLFLMSVTMLVAFIVLLLNSIIQGIHSILDPRLRR